MNLRHLLSGDTIAFAGTKTLCKYVRYSDVAQRAKIRYFQGKGMFGQNIISLISTNLGPFGAYPEMTFGLSCHIRWYTSIFQKLHRFLGNQRILKSIVFNSLFKSNNIFVLSLHILQILRVVEWLIVRSSSQF